MEPYPWAGYMTTLCHMGLVKPKCCSNGLLSGFFRPKQVTERLWKEAFWMVAQVGTAGSFCSLCDTVDCEPRQAGADLVSQTAWNTDCI